MAADNDDAAAARPPDTERDDAQSAYERGDRLAAQGDLEGAERAYREADERGHPTAAANVGLFSERRGEISEAEAAYRRADDRGDGVGAFRLGMLLSGRGDWPNANSAWSRAQERGKESPGLDLAALLRGHGDGSAEPERAAAARSAFANPVLVGAVTVLVVLVAVFLAYNANAGLPFVPTKQLKVDIADGSNLVIGNDVKEGGFRIGLVSAMRPVELASGQVGAQLTLQLDQANGSVPVDSRVTILPRSVLGLKYVDLARGSSRRLVADGGTLPVSQTSVPVQFDDIFKTFDTRTRGAIRQDLAGIGDTLAARGSALNDTIASLPGLLGHLRPVAQYLSDPGTGLTRLFRSLNAFMGALSPVVGVNVRLFGEAATTFAAVSRDPAALEATIARSPSTLDVSRDSLVTQQPFLVDLTSLGRSLTPATGELRRALPNINPAIEAGTRTLVRTPVLNAGLRGVMGALRRLALAPGTNVAINALSATVGTLNPMVRYLGPYQTVCDYWNYWWTYLSEHLSEQTQFGYAQRAMLNFADPTQPNNVGQQGATEPANGQARRPRIPPQPELRRGDRHARQRRLRDRAARLPATAEQLRPPAPQPRRRPAHPRQPGPDLPRPRPRSRRRDLQPQPPDRPATPLQPDQPVAAPRGPI